MNVGQVIGAVTRRVADREYEGKTAKVVVASRIYDTTPDDLWDALTNEERIPRWFTPITGDLKLGGRYQLKGNAGGTITTCEPPKALGVTWEYGGQVSWVNVRLTARATERTELELEHIAHVPADFWAQYGPGAVGVGWDLALLGLDMHLENPARPPLTPEEVEQWSASEEGRAYAKAASVDWGRAAIAAGTPEADAHGAMERTTAFYTGVTGG
jgi:uncharacterized protein YndB with AHSA1/START domain